MAGFQNVFQLIYTWWHGSSGASQSTVITSADVSWSTRSATVAFTKRTAQETWTSRSGVAAFTKRVASKVWTSRTATVTWET